MASLLDLPREIRDIILEMVLSSPRLAPTVSAIAKTSGVRQRASSLVKRVRNKQPDNNYVVTSTPLRLVNRQLSVETQYAVARLPTRHTYVLDALYVPQRGNLVPTWLLVPKKSTFVDEMMLTIRLLINNEEEAKLFDLRHRKASCPFIDMIPKIEKMLRSFLCYGLPMHPAEPKKGSPPASDVGMLVKTLTITLKVEPIASWAMKLRRERKASSGSALPHGRRSSIMGRTLSLSNGEDDDLIRECYDDCPVSFSVAILKWLGRSARHDLYSSPTTNPANTVMLFERIGRLHVILPTGSMHRYDLREKLACLGSFQQRAVRQWKVKALQMRKESGLDDLDQDDDIHSENSWGEDDHRRVGVGALEGPGTLQVSALGLLQP
jgi:hypothetical protein